MPKRSVVWNHYQQLPGNRARCEYCSQDVSFTGGSMGNLGRHLRQKHPKIELRAKSKAGEHDDLLNPNETTAAVISLNEEHTNENDVVNDQEIPKRKSSIVLAHFTLLSKDTAKCETCSQEVNITDGSSHSLIRHLKLQHPDSLNKDVDTEGAESSLNDGMPDREETIQDSVSMVLDKSIRKRSHVWTHFIQQVKGLAKCKLCSSLIRCQGSTGNLYRHLRSKHSVEINASEEFQMAPDNGKEPIVIDLGNLPVFSENIQTQIVELPSFEKKHIYDLCIIGSGLFGSAAARHASSNPLLRVALIGPDDLNQEGERCVKPFCTYHGTENIVSPIDAQLPMQKLIENSITRFSELEKLSGRKFYFPRGMLMFGEDGHKGIEEVKRTVALGKLKSSYVQGKEKLQAKCPFINFQEDNVGFVDSDGSGYVNQLQLIEAQHFVADLQGCDILSDLVKDILPLEKFNCIYYHKVMLESGYTILAKRILICTGAFTKFRCFPSERNGRSLRLKVVKAKAAMIQLCYAEAQKLQTMPIIKRFDSSSPNGIYLFPPVLALGQNPEGLYEMKIYNSTDANDPTVESVEEISEWYESMSDQKTLEGFLDVANELLPNVSFRSVKNSPFIACHTASFAPYVDRISPTVTVAVGGGERSAACSDEIGRIAAELCVNGLWKSEVPQLLFNAIWNKS